MTPEEAITKAVEKYASDDIEFDEMPNVSKSDDGMWVAAWVWVADTKDPEICPTCGDLRANCTGDVEE